MEKKIQENSQRNITSGYSWWRRRYNTYYSWRGRWWTRGCWSSGGYSHTFTQEYSSFPWCGSSYFNRTSEVDSADKRCISQQQDCRTVAQKDPDIENPEFQDLHSIGTIGSDRLNFLRCPMDRLLLLSRDGKEWYCRNLFPMIHTLLPRSKTIPEMKPDILSKDFDAIVGSLKRSVSQDY